MSSLFQQKYNFRILFISDNMGIQVKCTLQLKERLIGSIYKREICKQWIILLSHIIMKKLKPFFLASTSNRWLKFTRNKFSLYKKLIKLPAINRLRTILHCSTANKSKHPPNIPYGTALYLNNYVGTYVPTHVR
jgi:hypothetical protein